MHSACCEMHYYVQRRALHRFSLVLERVMTAFAGVPQRAASTVRQARSLEATVQTTELNGGGGPTEH